MMLMVRVSWSGITIAIAGGSWGKGVMERRAERGESFDWGRSWFFHVAVWRRVMRVGCARSAIEVGCCVGVCRG